MLEPLLRILVPHEPEMETLEIVGQGLESQQTRDVAVLKPAPAHFNLAGQISTLPIGLSKNHRHGQFEAVDWYAAGLGPRVRREGQVVEYSILGDPENFYQMAVCRGDIPWELVPIDLHGQIKDQLERTTAFFGGPSLLPSIPEQTTPHSSCSVEQTVPDSLPRENGVQNNQKERRRDPFPYRSNDEDAAALRNWFERVSEQRRIQSRLTSKET
ncbi:unnamed protein product [Echinostoma caproni]|uniref:Transposase n=1 Tax=Echinostoma caproni TaxID=27848 RepID=A0A183B8R7_9TREM|nr:unnamed protein product [Echinostoma caproni]